MLVEKVKVKNVTKIFGKQISLAKKLLREGKSKIVAIILDRITQSFNKTSK